MLLLCRHAKIQTPIWPRGAEQSWVMGCARGVEGRQHKSADGAQLIERHPHD